VLDELRRGDMLPRRVRRVARKISNAIRELENAGEAPSEQRIADSLGVPIEQYRRGPSHLVNVGVDPLRDDDQVLAPTSGSRRRAPVPAGVPAAG